MKKLYYFLILALVVISVSALAFPLKIDKGGNDIINDNTDSMKVDMDNIAIADKDSDRFSISSLGTLIEELDDHIYEDVGNFDKNLKWMDVYLDRLCEYYDSMNLGSKDISQYAKVDSIFQFLYRESNTKHIPMLQYYNVVAQIIEKCQSAEIKTLLKNDFTAWYDMIKSFSNIFDDICGIIGSGTELREMMSDVATDKVETYCSLFKWELKIMSGDPLRDGWYINGIYTDTAKDLLIDCCQRTLDGYTKWYEDNKDVDEYYEYRVEYARKANKEISLLSTKVDKWLKAHEVWANEVAHDWERNEGIYEKLSTKILIRLAENICIL